MNTIMVQMSDECWTMEAMHLACALAHNTNGQIMLLRLALANNPGLLGWDINPSTAKEQRQMEEYAAVAEDYGVDFCIQPMQYITQVDALVQAVELFHASVLFAHLPQKGIRFWRQFQLWSLKHKLGNCDLYTLDEEQPPSIKKSVSLQHPV
jgi:hypothetical protein